MPRLVCVMFVKCSEARVCKACLCGQGQSWTCTMPLCCRLFVFVTCAHALSSRLCACKARRVLMGVRSVGIWVGSSKDDARCKHAGLASPYPPSTTSRLIAPTHARISHRVRLGLQSDSSNAPKNASGKGIKLEIPSSSGGVVAGGAGWSSLCSLCVCLLCACLRVLRVYQCCPPHWTFAFQDVGVGLRLQHAHTYVRVLDTGGPSSSPVFRSTPVTPPTSDTSFLFDSQFHDGSRSPKPPSLPASLPCFGFGFAPHG